MDSSEFGTSHVGPHKWEGVGVEVAGGSAIPTVRPLGDHLTLLVLHAGAKQPRQDVGLYVKVQRLPEGVYLATSDDLPGLIVETETRDEIPDEVREVAGALLELRGRRLEGAVAFIYDD